MATVGATPVLGPACAPWSGGDERTSGASGYAALVEHELVERIRGALERRPEVVDGYVFGSLARGEARAHSDVDVAVYVSDEPDASFGYAAELMADLMVAVGSNRVDVVILNHAGPLLYHRVLRDGIRVVTRDALATSRREGRALSRYCDYVPQLAKIDRVAAARRRDGALGR